MIPTINLEEAESPGSDLSRLDAACREHGFFLLSHHGLEAPIESMWAESRAFFAESSDVKMSSSPVTNSKSRGKTPPTVAVEDLSELSLDKMSSIRDFNITTPTPSSKLKK